MDLTPEKFKFLASVLPGVIISRCDVHIPGGVPPISQATESGNGT